MVIKSKAIYHKNFIIKFSSSADLKFGIFDGTKIFDIF